MKSKSGISIMAVLGLMALLAIAIFTIISLFETTAKQKARMAIKSSTSTYNIQILQTLAMQCRSALSFCNNTFGNCSPSLTTGLISLIQRSSSVGIQLRDFGGGVLVNVPPVQNPIVSRQAAPELQRSQLERFFFVYPSDAELAMLGSPDISYKGRVLVSSARFVRSNTGYMATSGQMMPINAAIAGASAVLPVPAGHIYFEGQIEIKLDNSLFAGGMGSRELLVRNADGSLPYLGLLVTNSGTLVDCFTRGSALIEAATACRYLGGQYDPYNSQEGNRCRLQQMNIGLRPLSSLSSVDVGALRIRGSLEYIPDGSNQIRAPNIRCWTGNDPNVNSSCIYDSQPGLRKDGVMYMK